MLSTFGTEEVPTCPSETRLKSSGSSERLKVVRMRLLSGTRRKPKRSENPLFLDLDRATGDKGGNRQRSWSSHSQSCNRRQARPHVREDKKGCRRQAKGDRWEEFESKCEPRRRHLEPARIVTHATRGSPKGALPYQALANSPESIAPGHPSDGMSLFCK